MRTLMIFVALFMGNMVQAQFRFSEKIEHSNPRLMSPEVPQKQIFQEISPATDVIIKGEVYSHGEDRAPAPAFVHPGIMHNAAELDFIKAEVNAGKQPRKAWWNQFTALAVSQPDYKPTPSRRVDRGPYNKPDIGGNDFLRDGVAAYSHALQWAVTGDKSHAEKAIEIMNAWSGQLEVVTGHDTKLLIGMGGYKFCTAADIIASTYTGWSEKDRQQFRKMLVDVLYPFIRDFFPTANGNWDAAMIATMMSMGIFCDDHEMFDRAVDYYFKGEGNGAIGNYFMESGECQESGRDQGHTQMGMGYLGDACEIGWKQGVDMYGALNNRLFAGFEYTTKYNLGGEVLYVPYVSYKGKYNNLVISARSNRFSPIYEKVYHHYHDVMGLDMPWTKKVIELNRPEGMTIPGEAKWNFWGSLLYADLPPFPKGYDPKAPRSAASPMK